MTRMGAQSPKLWSQSQSHRQIRLPQPAPCPLCLESVLCSRRPLHACAHLLPGVQAFLLLQTLDDFDVSQMTHPGCRPSSPRACPCHSHAPILPVPVAGLGPLRSVARGVCCTCAHVFPSLQADSVPGRAHASDPFSLEFGR